MLQVRVTHLRRYTGPWGRAESCEREIERSVAGHNSFSAISKLCRPWWQRVSTLELDVFPVLSGLVLPFRSSSLTNCKSFSPHIRAPTGRQTNNTRNRLPRTAIFYPPDLKEPTYHCSPYPLSYSISRATNYLYHQEMSRSMTDRL
jgi:hypothetical protein